MAPAHIRLVDVSKTFRTRGKPDTSSVTALDAVDLEIPRGAITGIVGYSGAGKSTLVRLINALERPDSGHVFIDDTDLTLLSENRLQSIRGSIGMIFQHFNLFASRTVAGNIAYPLKVAGWSRADIAVRVDELLGFIGLQDKAKSYPQHLSGGQKQRVGIARALATRPTILLADEATSALDPETTAEVLGLVRRINHDFGTTVVVITHEMSVVRELCDRVVMMERGQVLESGSAYDVFAAPESAFTKRFVASATHSSPNSETVSRLSAKHRGTLATITIRHDFGTQDITNVFDEQGVRGSVVYGGVTEVSEKSLGALTYAIDGSPTSVTSTLERLALVSEVDVLHKNVEVTS